MGVEIDTDRTGSQMIKSVANQPWAHSINERLRDVLHLLPLVPPIYFVSEVLLCCRIDQTPPTTQQRWAKSCRDIFGTITNVKRVPNITSHGNHRGTSKCFFSSSFYLWTIYRWNSFAQLKKEFGLVFVLYVVRSKSFRFKDIKRVIKWTNYFYFAQSSFISIYIFRTMN